MGCVPSKYVMDGTTEELEIITPAELENANALLDLETHGLQQELGSTVDFFESCEKNLTCDFAQEECLVQDNLNACDEETTVNANDTNDETGLSDEKSAVENEVQACSTEDSAECVQDDDKNCSRFKKRPRRQAAVECTKRIRATLQWENLPNNAPEIKYLEKVFDREFRGEVLSPSELKELENDMEGDSNDFAEDDDVGNEESEIIEESDDDESYESSFIDDDSDEEMSSGESEKTWTPSAASSTASEEENSEDISDD